MTLREADMVEITVVTVVVLLAACYWYARLFREAGAVPVWLSDLLPDGMRCLPKARHAIAARAARAAAATSSLLKANNIL